MHDSVVVIMPNYNNARFLFKAMMSPLGARWRSGSKTPLYLVVGDDCSDKDGSRSIIRDFAREYCGRRNPEEKDRRGLYEDVVVYEAAQNLGKNHLLNELIPLAAATGARYAVVLDSDDQLAPSFFSFVLPVLHEIVTHQDGTRAGVLCVADDVEHMLDRERRGAHAPATVSLAQLKEMLRRYLAESCPENECGIVQGFGEYLMGAIDEEKGQTLSQNDRKALAFVLSCSEEENGHLSEDLANLTKTLDEAKKISATELSQFIESSCKAHQHGGRPGVVRFCDKLCALVEDPVRAHMKEFDKFLCEVRSSPKSKYNNVSFVYTGSILIDADNHMVGRGIPTAFDAELLKTKSFIPQTCAMLMQTLTRSIPFANPIRDPQTGKRPGTKRIMYENICQQSRAEGLYLPIKMGFSIPCTQEISRG